MARSLLSAVAALMVSFVLFLISGSASDRLPASFEAGILVLMTLFGCVLLSTGGRVRFSLARYARPGVWAIRVAVVSVWILAFGIFAAGVILSEDSFGLRTILLVFVPFFLLIIFSFLYFLNSKKGVGVSDSSTKWILLGDGNGSPSDWVKVTIDRPEESGRVVSAPCDVYVGHDQVGSLLPGGVSTFYITPGRHPIFLEFSGFSGPVEYFHGSGGDLLRFTVRKCEGLGWRESLLNPGSHLTLHGPNC